MEDFEEVYKLYSLKLFTFFYCRCEDAHTAEELLQETFYQALYPIHRFKGDSNVSTWLYQIAKNVYRKYQEKNAAEKSAAQF